MFNNLNAEMARKKISIKALAEATGINYESLKNKMSGTTEFKRSEMVRIKKEFSNCSLDYLFATEGE
ncbi:helix-turn-helix transcriptional regulator [uncultured Clostridium sp.]|uniref:helix-turn-helix domain-containing protein n=1 Tax=uncultured Clostridium sp. TaxID=59620 RepID=UPI00266EF32B|nr:helix-turn-helix transcriptional regulator [uncultured Clostridium sp.]